MKIAYQIAVILFLIMSFFYLLDKWGVLAFEDYLPGLKKQAPLLVEEVEAEVANDAVSLRWDEIRKGEEKFKVQKQELEDLAKNLKTTQQELKSKQQALKEQEQNLIQQQQQLETEKEEFRQVKVRQQQIVDKVTSIEPTQAAAILENLTPKEIVRILTAVDAQAERDNQKSISPYLLSLLSKEKSSAVLQDMLEKNQQQTTPTDFSQ